MDKTRHSEFISESRKKLMQMLKQSELKDEFEFSMTLLLTKSCHSEFISESIKENCKQSVSENSHFVFRHLDK